MIRTVIYGCRGKMGRVLKEQLSELTDFQVVAGIDQESSRNSGESSREGDYNFPVFENPMDYTGEVDVIIDFSNPSNLPQLIAFSLVKKAAVVVATTGYTESQKQELYKLSSNVPVLHSANMSLGINVLAKVLRQMGGLLSESFDIEIIEKHHNKKIDAPSGTALYLANQINQSIGTTYRFSYGREGTDAKRNDKEIGIHAVRGGTIAGEHTVIFAGMDEVIELKHTAHSKNIFAIGAIKAAKFLSEKSAGFYTMEDIFNECKF